MEEAATKIVRTLQEAGHRALFAGGCVRDRLRGVTPQDYDIATDAKPEEILRLFPGGNTVGAHFGVVLVRRHGHPFEIATFREDGPYSDGRRPDSVTFSTAERDARRRDFTINGLFFDPVADELIDYVHGREDVAAGIVRAIDDPAWRFEEDQLRLLRAVRFATTLEYEIEPDTWKALVATADRIERVSPERIREEMNRIWTSPHRVRGFDLLVESGLMRAILPEILELRGCEQPPRWHPEGDVFVHTRLMLEKLPPDAGLELVLSVLFHDIGKPATFSRDEETGRIRFSGHDKVGARMTETILRRLRHPNSVIEAVVSAVENHMVFKDVKNMRRSRLKRFMAREHFEDELELHRVDCAASHGKLGNYDFLQEKQEEWENEPIIPPSFLTGRDLIERGLEPGPAFGEILTQAQDMQLEGELNSREEALEWLDRRLATADP